MSSIVWNLRRLVDATFREEQEDRRRQGETVPVDPERDGTARRVRPAEPPPAVRWVCRVCEREQDFGDYCTDCLADTMDRG